MNLKLYIEKIRTWGLKGIANFFLGKLKRLYYNWYFHSNAAKYPYKTPEYGITLIADFHSDLSLNKVMRDLALSLHDAGIPFQTFDTGSRKSLKALEADPYLTPRKDFRIMRFKTVVEMFSSPIPNDLGLNKSHILFWEFESGLCESFPNVNSPDTVIAMSDFNADYFRRVLSPATPVKKIIYPFRFDIHDIAPAEEIRAKYHIRPSDFVVFFNFDYGSSFFRKNPDGVMKAFAMAFGEKADARLVFKTIRAQEHRREQDKLNKLADSLGISSRFISIDNYIPQKDLYGLANACDVYISLHRGEGFGLGIAEAMSFGKPVIVSDYSAPKEFCNDNTAFLIPCSSINISKEQHDHPCYTYVKSCADPDLSAAAKALRLCYDDRPLSRTTGARGKAFIEKHFSLAAFKKSITTFLG